jgi:hypothetical protein
LKLPPKYLLPVLLNFYLALNRLSGLSLLKLCIFLKNQSVFAFIAPMKNKPSEDENLALLYSV